MAADDRLSNLSDDLLRRILHFTPAKEAASTTALSRRWRLPLWRSSGAVNLETQVEDYDGGRPLRRDPEFEKLLLSRRDAFISVAVAALDASAADDHHVKRLTLRLESDSDNDQTVDKFLNSSKESSWSHYLHGKGMIPAVLSHRAVRRVEELRLVAKDWSRDACYDGEIDSDTVGIYKLTLDTLPSETLRLLEITNCKGLYLLDAAIVVLPRLSSLRLRHCTQNLASLQSVMDAAPALAVVRLESVLIQVTDDAPSESDDDWDDMGNDGPLPPVGVAPICLRCPAATMLVLERCRWVTVKVEHNQRWRGHHHFGYGYQEEKPAALIAVEIDAPRLRRFRYKGLLRHFSFCSPLREMEQADLQFFRDDNSFGYTDVPCSLETFWRFVQSFTSAKEIKLRLNILEDIAVLAEARRVELLPIFHCLQCLELHGMHGPKGKTGAVAIANLLRCCPVLSELWMNLTAWHHTATKKHQYTRDFLKRKFKYDRDKCIDHLNRSDSEMTTISPQVDVDGVNYNEISEIPGLSGHSFQCLQSSLRRVGLRFRLEQSTCLGMKLIKFFTENAMVLEEMRIDDGNGKLWEHVNRRVESMGRKVGASSFVVLPLKS